LFRYPGGKNKVKNQIVGRISRFYYDERCFDSKMFVEPFFGAGSIGLYFASISNLKDICINDADPAIAAFWTAVINSPDILCDYVDRFKPTTRKFYAYQRLLSDPSIVKKALEGDPEEEVFIGFIKLAIHQISYSGLGVMAGGPLGGEDQGSEYKIDCRWNPDKIKKDVHKYNKLFSKMNLEGNKCYNLDFEEIIDMTMGKTFLYLDPPYYVKGPELYQYNFGDEEHIRLMKLLKDIKCPWLLSYDDAERVRELYSWAKIIELPLKYSIGGATDKTELLIASSRYEFLLNPLEESIFEEQIEKI